MGIALLEITSSHSLWKYIILPEIPPLVFNDYLIDGLAESFSRLTMSATFTSHFPDLKKWGAPLSDLTNIQVPI